MANGPATAWSRELGLQCCWAPAWGPGTRCWAAAPGSCRPARCSGPPQLHGRPRRAATASSAPARTAASHRQPVSPSGAPRPARRTCRCCARGRPSPKSARGPPGSPRRCPPCRSGSSTPWECRRAGSTRASARPLAPPQPALRRRLRAQPPLPDSASAGRRARALSRRTENAFAGAVADGPRPHGAARPPPVPPNGADPGRSPAASPDNQRRASSAGWAAIAHLRAPPRRPGRGHAVVPAPSPRCRPAGPRGPGPPPPP
mmetsp:Transcript_70744/g.229152  ORF Transcript_70744/g.229152 Transcript_70744/m.229152 type:complete len:260 (-) Transcript_70744:1049-1828(-)